MTLPRLRRIIPAFVMAGVWTISVQAHELPLGDGHISDAPRVGYIYSCQTRFGGGGAFRDGPWIDGNYWYPERKIQVMGAVSWSDARMNITPQERLRRVSGNGLPVGATTGIFPVQYNDPAYQYDRNPNTITAQAIELRLPRNPTMAASPQCVGMGMIGISLLGVAIFNGLDGQ